MKIIGMVMNMKKYKGTICVLSILGSPYDFQRGMYHLKIIGVDSVFFNLDISNTLLGLKMSSGPAEQRKVSNSDPEKMLSFRTGSHDAKAEERDRFVNLGEFKFKFEKMK